MIWTEFRALAPTWLAIVVAMVAADYSHSSLRGLGPVAYFLGAVTLGAQAIGHEYSHRTLTMLLTQPVSRQRILLVKLGVLAALLAALVGVAAIGLSFFRLDSRYIAGVIGMPLALGLFVAPWLTMAARSALAGTVFPVALVGIARITAMWLGVRFFGYTRGVDAFVVTFMWWTIGGLCAVGALMTWRTFLRLQVIDGPAGPLGVRARPHAAIAAEGLTKRSATWLLVKKELHLQQLPLVFGLLYVAIYVLAFTWVRGDFRFADAFTALTVLHAGLLAVLIGALASAEERQMGTIEWQMLLPMAAWRQWAVKAGTAIGLALVLGVALPLLLVSLLPPEQPQNFGPLVRPSIFGFITALTIGSLYVSSLCGSGMVALVTIVPAVVGWAIFLQTVVAPMERAIYGAFGHPGRVWRPVPWMTQEYAMGMVLAFATVLALVLGLRNHASAERGAVRAIPQVALLVACVTGGFGLVLVLGALLR